MKAINLLKETIWDRHTTARIATLHPAIRDKAKAFIIRADKELGIKLRVYSAHRSWQEQKALYLRTSDGIDNDRDGRIDEADERVTFAAPGESYHNYGLAIDVVEIKNGKALWNNPNWNKIGALGKSLGFEWGGDWRGAKRDRPHFQMRFGKHHSELARLYRAGQKKGNYVSLT